MDDALLDVVLGRIDNDTTLSEGVTDLLLAACQGDTALAESIGGSPPSRPASSSGAQRVAEAGVYLGSITVKGFRGVGPAAILRLHPGRGLTVVAGRNGSGKSSFAEGLEVLLTGSADRFRSSAVFREGWRNLHQQGPSRVRAEFHVDGTAGATVVERTWESGADLDTSSCWAQAAGQRKVGFDQVGWADDLARYRPFLAHGDLARLCTDKPSDLYDRLVEVLGLGDLTAAQQRLAGERRRLEVQAKAAETERKDIVAALAAVDDERASSVHPALAKRWPDVDAVGHLVSADPPSGADGVVAPLRHLANLLAPDPAAATRAAERLRDAAAGVESVAGTKAARARSTADLLEGALRFHHDHPGDEACPVCGRADALDAAWRRQAAVEVSRLRTEAGAAEAAHREAGAAYRDAARLIAQVPAGLDGPVADIVDTSGLAEAWGRWTQPPAGTAEDPAALRSLADHLGQASDVAAAAEKVRSVAREELARRDDRWAPIAERVTAWLPQGRAAHNSRNTIKHLKVAEAWLKAAHDDIRNDRLQPIAGRAQAIWETLRHESNVALGGIRLAGANTRRQVVLDATVDGSSSSALGVMSQGEVNALALSIFLPRATLPESPFRFVVIDDPVQAMDPAKVDGLARALHQAAQTHQVVVFTHDDRLPNALRNLDLDARVIEVQRRPDSFVELHPAGDPVSRALRDARSILKDAHVPPEVKALVVPGQCRQAVEAALTDLTARSQIRAGTSRHDLDTLLAGAKTLRHKAALAFYGDVRRADDVKSRLNRLGGRHRETFDELNRGAHGEFTGPVAGIVDDTAGLIGALQQALT